MNYWPAEPTNLGECVEPLVRMIMELTETGARTVLVAAGTQPNTVLVREDASHFHLDGKYFQAFDENGQKVRIFNDRGSTVLQVKVTRRIAAISGVAPSA